MNADKPQSARPGQNSWETRRHDPLIGDTPYLTEITV